MKARILNLLIFGLIIACQPGPGPFPAGRASAELNGKPWVANRASCAINTPCYKGRLGINLYKHWANGTVESLSFHKIPNQVGLYRIAPAAADNATFCKDTSVNSNFSNTTPDGDVSKDFYESVDVATNYVQITDINRKTGEVRGKFDVTYVIFIRQDRTSPDTIRITNGQFQARIRD
jgi:hypothetical protein